MPKIDGEYPPPSNPFVHSLVASYAFAKSTNPQLIFFFFLSPINTKPPLLFRCHIFQKHLMMDRRIFCCYIIRSCLILAPHFWPLCVQVRALETYCGSLSRYGMKHLRSLANICNAGVRVEAMTKVAAEACPNIPSNSWSLLPKGFSAWVFLCCFLCEQRWSDDIWNKIYIRFSLFEIISFGAKHIIWDVIIKWRMILFDQAVEDWSQIISH